MPRPRILVTRRWPEAVERRLCELFDTTLNTDDQRLSADELRAALRDFDAVLPTVSDRLDASVLTVDAPRARILANYGVGYSHIDVDAARARGVVVTNTPGVLTDCTADLALTLMLMVARRAGEGEREVRAGQWSGWRPTHLVGTRLSGKTLGIIGMGRIAIAVGRLMQGSYLGQVIGPSLFGSVVQAAGWPAAAWPVGLAALGAVAAAVALRGSFAAEGGRG